MCEGEGRDEAGEKEPQDDKEDPNNDHDVYQFLRRWLGGWFPGSVFDGVFGFTADGLAVRPPTRRVPLLRGRHELVASNSRPSVGNGRTEIGMCGASNAHQVQRRTAKLSPDWLKDSATTTLHPLGRVVSNPVLPKLLAAVHISRSRPVRPPPADTQCAVSNEPSTPEAAHRRPAPTSPLGLPRLRNPRSTAPQPYLCVVRRGGCPHRVLRGWSSTACR